MNVKERLARLVEALPEDRAGELLKTLEEEDRARQAAAQRSKPQASGYGKFAHVPGSVDDFLRRKREDLDQEEEQAARRWRGAG